MTTSEHLGDCGCKITVFRNDSGILTKLEIVHASACWPPTRNYRNCLVETFVTEGANVHISK